ncbi:uncharacterized protein LOC110237894 [Exaiptasia diaphana]|uniref:PARP catalytic domain-containing protein n=1 Tax=Exaiptasia diaphana TaxID=2652724 RepID=A0A913X6B3_EXADI|nr:uncharacterized protein LOC110237894 [Exaiptasia diaphana]
MVVHDHDPTEIGRPNSSPKQRESYTERNESELEEGKKQYDVSTYPRSKLHKEKHDGLQYFKVVHILGLRNLDHFGKLPGDVILHNGTKDRILIELEKNYEVKDESIRQSLSAQLLNDLGFERQSDAVKTILSRSNLVPDHVDPIDAVTRFVVDKFKYNENCKTEWEKKNPLTGTLPEDVTQRLYCKTAFEGASLGVLGYDIESVIRTSINELQESNHVQVLYHGTDMDSAYDILKGGIAVSMGSQKRDFSDGRGFYLTKNFEDAKNWAFSTTQKPVVLVFCIPKTLLREAKKLSLLGESERSRWEMIVNANRSGILDWQMRQKLKEFECIEGPVSSVSDGIRRPKPNSYQLCITKENFADVISKYLKRIVQFCDNE